MALYYHLVFALLIVEVAFFTTLSLPLPRPIRRRVLTIFSAPFRNEQFQMGLKCVIGFVLVLFIDSMNRVYSVTKELDQFLSTTGIPGAGVLTDRSEVQARKFYAQRNMYLCGFTLFLTLILSRTYLLVVELINTKDKLDIFKANGVLASSKDDSTVIADLKEQLAKKDEDLEILKEQAKSLSKEYATVKN